MRLVIGNKVYSSWSMRPWILMRAHGIAFEETLVRLREADSSSEIRRHSPSGKVPCLIDGDRIVWDSLAIVEYLAERFPEKVIWPRDAAARAHARCISAEMHSGFQSLRNECPMTITKRFRARERSADTMRDVARIIDIWRESRGRFGERAEGSSHGPFLYGAFTAADAMYAPVVTRFHSYAIPVDAAAAAYMKAVMAHAAFQDWLAGAVAEPWVIGEPDEPVVEDLRAKSAR